MPALSKSQLRLMFASLKSNSNTGVPIDVARDFVNSTPKSSFPKLQERLHPQRIKNNIKTPKKRNVR